MKYQPLGRRSGMRLRSRTGCPKVIAIDGITAVFEDGKKPGR
jgi:hypothetical protein